jgi:hypothetical protein
MGERRGWPSWDEIKAEFLEAQSPEDRLRYEGYQRGAREIWEEMQQYYDELKAAGDVLARHLREAQLSASWLCNEEIMGALEQWEHPHI